MRVPINLASQPLENLRPIRTAVAVAAAVALFLSVVIVQRELRTRNEFRNLIQQQGVLEQDLARLHGQQSELESWLQTPQSQQIRARSAFLNALILRKSLSWTRLFLDLEKTLPARAHITSIRPSLTPAHDVDLTLTVAGAEMAPLVDFLKKLESSPEFGPPVVDTQRRDSDRGAKGEIALELTTRYQQRRETGSAPAAAAADTAAENRAMNDAPREAAP